MKCPWCNAELKEGAVYCDVCGEEIYIVPDFDPEIEDTCRETIESMTKGYFAGKKAAASINSDGKKSEKAGNSNNPEDAKTPQKKESESNGKKTDDGKSEKDKVVNSETKKTKETSIFHVLRFTLFASLTAVLIVAAVCIYFNVTSESYRLSKADEAYSKGNYEKAEIIYEELLNKDRFNADLMVKLSNTFQAEGKAEEYEEYLLKIADSSFVSLDQRTDAVKNLIVIYDKAGEYDKITELISSCGLDGIKEGYSYYFSSEPVFDILPGTYDTIMSLGISGESDIYVTIVHTVDGDEVTEAENELYTNKIELMRGNYKVSAYCLNKYGIKSETVCEEYVIDIIPPDDPSVLLPEGTYVSPQLLEVEYDADNSTLYYTVGGDTPDTDSQIYTGPIMLPYGITEYSFMCADENGLFSNVVTVTYDLEYEYLIAPAVAQDLLINYLLEKEIMISYDGTLQDGGRMGLELRYFDLLNESYCYVFEEVLLSDDSSDKVSTNMDVFYAVDMINGEISRIE